MLASQEGFSRILKLHGIMSLSLNIVLLTDHLKLIHHPPGSASLMDEKTCNNATSWVFNTGCSVNFLHDIWIPYHNNIRNCIQGPLNSDEKAIKIKDLFNNGVWILIRLSFSLPQALIFAIQNTYVPSTSSVNDKLVSRLTSDDLFTTKFSYKLLDSKDDSFVQQNNNNFQLDLED